MPAADSMPVQIVTAVAAATIVTAAAATAGNRLFEAVDIMVPSIGALHEVVAVEALQATTAWPLFLTASLCMPPDCAAARPPRNSGEAHLQLRG